MGVKAASAETEDWKKGTEHRFGRLGYTDCGHRYKIKSSCQCFVSGLFGFC